MNKLNEQMGCALDTPAYKQTDADIIIELLHQVEALASRTESAAFEKLKCVINTDNKSISSDEEYPVEKMTPLFAEMRAIINRIHWKIETISEDVGLAELPIWKGQ